MRFLVFVSALFGFLSSAWAQSPCEEYAIRSGDNLSRIARASLGDARKWTFIYQTNIEVIGQNPHLILIGDVLRIPCINEADEDAGVAGWTGGDDKPLTLLTANDYAPFTDRSLPAGVLVTEIVDRALATTIGSDEYGIVWRDDWSQHLSPLLSERTFDMGFPWLRPDCAATPDEERCRNFVFSEPMFEMLVLLFTERRGGIQFTRDADIVGKTLCRPSGYYTHDLDKDGRNWLRDDKIRLLMPSSVEDCFRLLQEGLVDAVALNEFTGRSAIKAMGIENDIRIVQSRPLSIEGLHVLVHRDHPEAERLIGLVNEGIRSLREDGQYQAIVDRHMNAFWSRLDS